MLETCVNQGAGLRGIAKQTVPRVIAMASHGDQQGELPLLWSLCSTLVDFGYPVAVLDATTVESANNPGLEQLMDEVYWPGDLTSEALSWSVIPAALGLRRLGARKAGSGLPLDPLSGLFQSFGVIVIYARADVLTRVLPDSGIEPLLTVSPAKMSPVTAYQALKQMLLDAKLRPTIASLVPEPLSKGGVVASSSPVENLQKCAMTFLGYRLDSLVIRTVQAQDRPSDDMHRLALRLLENAMPLHSNHFVGSH
jgi:hypothetical protein